MRKLPQGKDGGAACSLTSGSLHLWRIPLDLDPAERARLASKLSSEEEARARSLRFARHRERFIVAHGALRSILAPHLGRGPADLEFTSDPGGKPRIDHQAGEIDLRFSLSHSHDLALVAVAAGREVGVDIERIDARTKVLRLAERYFTPEEAAALRALSPEARVEGFFRCWTLKEAYLKALGTGIRVPLDSFAVSLESEGPARLLWSARGDAMSWTVQSLAPAAQYVAAVVAEGEIDGLELRDWAVDSEGRSIGG